MHCTLGGGCLLIEWRSKGKRSFAMPSCRSEKWAHHMGSVTGGGAWDKVGHWPKLEGLAFVYTQCQEQHAKLVLRVIALPLSLFLFLSLKAFVGKNRSTSLSRWARTLCGQVQRPPWTLGAKWPRKANIHLGCLALHVSHCLCMSLP